MEQGLAIVSPIVEGVTNLTAGVIGGHWFGAKGVAAGMLIGSVVGILIHFVRDLRRITEIRISMKKVLCDGLVGRLSCGGTDPRRGVAGRGVERSLYIVDSVRIISINGSRSVEMGTLQSEHEWLKSHLL